MPGVMAQVNQEALGKGPCDKKLNLTGPVCGRYDLSCHLPHYLLIWAPVQVPDFPLWFVLFLLFKESFIYLEELQK